MYNKNGMLLLKETIKGVIEEEWWAESYDKNLLDDPAFDERSVYVPEDIKVSIRKWAKSMGLYHSKQPR